MCDKWAGYFFLWHCSRVLSYDFSNLQQTHIFDSSYLAVAPGWKMFVKWIFKCLLSRDLTGLAIRALDHQTLLKMLQTYSGFKASETEIEFCFWSAHFRLECSILSASNTLQLLSITSFEVDWFTIICSQSPMFKLSALRLLLMISLKHFRFISWISTIIQPFIEKPNVHHHGKVPSPPHLIAYEQHLKGALSWTVIVIIFTNCFARAGYDTRSIFKWSLTSLNSEFSFS